MTRRGSRAVFWSVFVFVLVAQAAIDAAMGAEAEFFNAWVVWVKATGWLHGLPPPHDRYIVGQDALGRLALPAAIMLALAIPALAGWVVTTLVRRLRR